VWEEGLGAFRQRRKHAVLGARRRRQRRPWRGSAFTREEKGGEAFIAGARRLGRSLRAKVSRVSVRTAVWLRYGRVWAAACDSRWPITARGRRGVAGVQALRGLAVDP
jgi:hypothetical protein